MEKKGKIYVGDYLMVWLEKKHKTTIDGCNNPDCAVENELTMLMNNQYKPCRKCQKLVISVTEEFYVRPDVLWNQDPFKLDTGFLEPIKCQGNLLAFIPENTGFFLENDDKNICYNGLDSADFFAPGIFKFEENEFVKFLGDMGFSYKPTFGIVKIA